MKTLGRLNLIALTVACVAAMLASNPANANAGPKVNITPVRANAGVTFVFEPTADPTVFKAIVTGVVQNSPLGTCIDAATLVVRFPTTAGQPVLINGTATWTSIDGKNSLRLNVAGTATPDPVNPGFYNNQYQITFTGGTGAYASARGDAQINEVVMFTSPLTGTATWTVKGAVVVPR
jgi:hypothetical protein